MNKYLGFAAAAALAVGLMSGVAYAADNNNDCAQAGTPVGPVVTIVEGHMLCVDSAGVDFDGHNGTSPGSQTGETTVTTSSGTTTINADTTVDGLSRPRD